MSTDDQSIAKGACAVVEAGTEWVLQVRDNIDGILWPGKVALWGGAVESADEGSFERAILRELHEELRLLPEDIELTPISEKSSTRSRVDGSHGTQRVKIFHAKLVVERALHVYEGAGLFRIEIAGFPDNISEQSFAPYVLETLHQLHAMKARSIEV